MTSQYLQENNLKNMHEKRGFSARLTTQLLLPLPGKNDGAHQLLFRHLRQENLTKTGKFITIIDTKITSSKMAKFRTALATLAGIGLTACGNAEAAADKVEASEVTPTKVAALIETATVTRADCLALRTQTDLMKACMVKLSDQRKAEIAARNERIENKTNENVDLDEKIAKGNTTVEGLTNEVEGLKKVVAMQEEPIH